LHGPAGKLPEKGPLAAASGHHQHGEPGKTARVAAIDSNQSEGSAIMRVLATTLALTLFTAASASAAKQALSEEQIEGVQAAIEEMGCTVADSEIEIEGKWFEADDVICDRVKYEVYLDKNFEVLNKVKEED
jgi:hypothetical protein